MLEPDARAKKCEMCKKFTKIINVNGNSNGNGHNHHHHHNHNHHLKTTVEYCQLLLENAAKNYPLINWIKQGMRKSSRS